MLVEFSYLKLGKTKLQVDQVNHVIMSNQVNQLEKSKWKGLLGVIGTLQPSWKLWASPRSPCLSLILLDPPRPQKFGKTC